MWHPWGLSPKNGACEQSRNIACEQAHNIPSVIFKLKFPTESHWCVFFVLLRRADSSYVGCFQEPVQGMHAWRQITSSSATTVGTCKQLARDAGYMYAGLQFYRECYGSNNTLNITQPGTCDTPCDGNNAELCGGIWTYGVYLTKGMFFTMEQADSLGRQLGVLSRDNCFAVSGNKPACKGKQRAHYIAHLHCTARWVPLALMQSRWAPDILMAF